LQAGNSLSGQKLIEVLCQGEKLLVFPRQIEVPNGSVIKFVSLWGKLAPYVVVNGSYSPEVLIENKESTDKYFGHFYVGSEKIRNFTIDGCYVEWGG
jgi:Zn-dependent peptidase ImmA (M78 family)